MTTEKNQELIENEDNKTADELLELKKKLAEEVVNKLQEKDSNIISVLSKGSIADYLVDEDTVRDAVHDEFIMGNFGESLGIIDASLKKYREMFKEAKTKNDLENLKTNIFNGIESNSSNTQSQETSSSSSNTQLSNSTQESTGTNEKAKVDTSSESYELDHLNFAISAETKKIYDNIKGKEKPDLEPFACALKLYKSLNKQGKLKNTKYLTVVDFTKGKSKNRLFVINTNNRTVEHAVKCGHGKGSGTGEYATSFGNKGGSNKSSLGGYITPDTITKTTKKSGWYGLRQIHGIESSNDAAGGRGIAIHPGGVDGSEGCFTIPKNVSNEIMNKQKGGSLLFAYAESKEYFAQSNYFQKNPDGSIMA